MVLQHPSTSQEMSWKGSGLSVAELDIILSDSNCQRSIKNKLACINAIETIAEYFSLKLFFKTDLQLDLAPNHSKVLQSEKNRMVEWKAIISKFGNSKIKIGQAWNVIKDKIQENGIQEYLVGLGLNSYLAIQKDPHSYLMPKYFYQSVIGNSKPVLNSYGFSISKVGSKAYFSRIYQGTLFSNLGIRRGDELLALDGHSISNDRADEISNFLKSKDDHIFRIKSLNEIKEFHANKIQQTLPSVGYELIDGYNHSQYHLLSIYKISEGICSAVHDHLAKVNLDIKKGLILDLRDNSGGSMDEVLCIAGLFLGEVKLYDLVFFDRKYKKESFYTSTDQIYKGPLVVLVNRSTASSAEVLAGGLKHYGRGFLVGERTFGKGSFQEGQEWEQNKNLLFFQTKGTFHLPDGNTPQIVGIVPDIEILDPWASETQREEDLYFNPFPNLVHSFFVGNEKLHSSRCLKEVVTADKLLGKALGQIQCQGL